MKEKPVASSVQREALANTVVHANWRLPSLGACNNVPHARPATSDLQLWVVRLDEEAALRAAQGSGTVARESD